VQLGLLIPGLVPQCLSVQLRALLQLSTHAVYPSPAGTDCLFFVPIPWQQDVRHFTFGAFVENAAFEPSAGQLAVVDKLIDALDMTAVVSFHYGCVGDVTYAAPLPKPLSLLAAR
jgi:hypothetical protein